MPPVKPCVFYDGARYVVSESIGHQLVNLMTMMRREVELRMVEHGLTDAQWKPLWMLQTGRATTAIELAREMDVDAGAITRMVDRLEAKGLIQRARSEFDRRVVQLVLTPAGAATAAQIPHVMASVNNDFLRGFSESEWKQLGKLLERMADTGKAMQTAGAGA